MTRFNPSKVNNPCPICGDITGDCRTQDDLILCHSFIEQDSGIAGYKFLKTSSNSVWGVHVPDNGKEFDREKYERYLAQKAEQEKNKKQFLLDNALDADGRDKAIRKLSRYVGLSDSSREDLRRRGLSDRQIEAGLFFSIDPWMRLNLDLPDNLPGIHWKGDRFATKDSGYACPIFDSQGRAIGWQLRVEGATKGNKYKWAKSNFSSKLPNDEYPIIHIPSLNNPHCLVLTEGILKPYIAANKLNLSVCGASGGYFAGSSQQFALIQANYEVLAIAPDAGDVLNPQVMQRWEKQISFLKSFNKPIKVLWWSQVDKNQHQDIDEIDIETFSKVKYLTTKEFLELAKKQQYIKQQWDTWRTYKKFTPQIKIEKKFVEYGLPQKNTITFIKSPIGSGKTTQLIKHLSQLQDYGIIGAGYRNTLLLQFNEKAKKIGFYHLQSDKNLREFSLDDPQLKVTNCVDSLIYYVKEQFDGKIIVIDEIISVLKHLLYSSTIKQFAKVKELFTEMVNRADRIICLDGFMQDWAVTFFKELCPKKQIVTIENTYYGDKPQVYLLEGTIDIDEKIRVNDKTPYLEKTSNSQCPAICADSQIACEAFENLLLEQGRQGIRVDSKTVSEQYVKDFFTDPDKWIQENKPEYLIYSPSAESGLDIPTLNYFTEQFSFFFGALDTDSCLQMIGRIRDTAVPRYVWCKQFIRPIDTVRRPSNIEDIQADRARNLMKELNSLAIAAENLSKETIISQIQQIHSNNLDSYTTAADTITAIRNHEFANYRECLKDQLINCGHPVEAVTLESIAQRAAIALCEKGAKTEVKEQNSRDIFHASDRLIGQSNINLSFDASWSTRCEVEKAKLVNRLPSINESSVWNPDFIKLVRYDRPNLIKQVELYHLLFNPDLALAVATLKYNKIFNRGSIAAPWKLRQDYLKIKTLRDIGLHDFIQTTLEIPEYSYNADTPEVREILRKCHHRKNKQVLGKLRKHPIKFFNNLLRDHFGIEIKSQRLRDENGDRYRSYSIDYQSSYSQERLAILRSIELKYEQKLNSMNESDNWSQMPENNSENCSEKSRGQKQPQAIEMHGFNPVPHDPYFVIKTKPKWDNNDRLNSTGNSSMKLNNTSNLQNSRPSSNSIRGSKRECIPHPLDSEEAIADLASYLNIVEDADDLRELQQVPEFTANRLRRACALLPKEKILQIKQFAIINHEKRKSLA